MSFLMKDFKCQDSGGNGKRKSVEESGPNIIGTIFGDAVIIEVDVHNVLKSKCNRVHNENWSSQIAKNWNWNLYQLITVNHWNGCDYVIDGQHRLEAAKKAGISKLPAWRINVHPEKEKDVFLDLTKKRKGISVFDKYNILLAYGDPDTIKLHRIFTKFNLGVARSLGPTARHICVGVIYAILKARPRTKDRFFTALEETLCILTSAWPNNPDATSKMLVKTLSYFIERTIGNSNYNRKHFIRQLSRETPIDLLSKIPQKDPDERFFTTYLSIHNNRLRTENKITIESLASSGKR